MKTGVLCGWFVVLVLAACTSEPEETAPVQLRPAAETDSLLDRYFEDPEHPDAQRALALISNPLGVKDPLLLPSYTSAFADCDASMKPTANRHDSTQTDTAVTLECRGVELQLYQLQQGDKAFLVKAVVTAKDIPVGPFHVGMNGDAARDSARALWLPATETNLRLVLEDPEVGNRLSVYLRRGRVNKLIYEGYVD